VTAHFAKLASRTGRHNNLLPHIPTDYAVKILYRTNFFGDYDYDRYVPWSLPIPRTTTDELAWSRSPSSWPIVSQPSELIRTPQFRAIADVVQL
jgi:hypothetical protein